MSSLPSSCPTTAGSLQLEVKLWEYGWAGHLKSHVYADCAFLKMSGSPNCGPFFSPLVKASPLQRDPKQGP